MEISAEENFNSIWYDYKQLQRFLNKINRNFNSIWYDYKWRPPRRRWSSSSISIPYGTIIRFHRFSSWASCCISIPYGTIISFTALRLRLQLPHFNSIWYDYKAAFLFLLPLFWNFNSIWYDYKPPRPCRNTSTCRISIPYGTIISEKGLFTYNDAVVFQFHMVRL